MTPEQLQLIKEIYALLVPSNVHDLVYRTPADSLRMQANEIERKEILISKLKKEIYFWENGEYPKEPEVSTI